MSTYRVKLGIHVVGGLVRRAGDQFELESKTFADSPERTKFFEKLPEVKKTAELKKVVTPEGAGATGGTAGATGGTAGAPEGAGATGGTAGAPEAEKKVTKKAGRKPKASAGV